MLALHIINYYVDKANNEFIILYLIISLHYFTITNQSLTLVGDQDQGINYTFQFLHKVVLSLFILYLIQFYFCNGFMAVVIFLRSFCSGVTVALDKSFL